MGAFFHLFGQLYLALGTNPRSQFLAYVFLENGLWSESLESLIGFLAYLEANLWLKNHILFKNKKVSRKVQFLLLRQILVSHNSAADWAKELFKLSEKPTKSCSLEWKKKVFNFGFLVDDTMIGVCFAVLLTVSSANPMSRFCGSKFYWKLGYNTSL